jgi:maltose-binding protein MalE
MGLRSGPVAKAGRPFNRAERHRRQRSLLVAALAILALAAGCSSSGSSGSGGSTHGVHLTYALWDPVQEVGYKKSIAVFEKSHPGITVSVEQIPYPDYEAKLTSEFSSGSGPDVFWVNTPFLAQFEQAGVMLNLDSLIKKYHVDMSIYRPALVALHSHDGAIYGLPKDWDTEGIFYNKAYFAAHHIQVPASLTWNPVNGGSFLTLAREATIDENGNSALSPKFDPGQVATYGVAIVNQPDIGYGPFLASDGVPVFQQASLAAGVKCSCYPDSVMFDNAAGIASIDTTFLDYWKAKGVDVSPFLAEAQDSANVETLPVAPQAGQVIVSLASDLGPAWLGDESVSKAVATAARDANQELQHPSQ